MENKVDNLTARVTLLETLVNNIKNYFYFMPYFIKKLTENDIVADFMGLLAWAA